MYRTSPQLATFKPVMAAVRDVIGLESPIFRAAMQAARGRDPGGSKFLQLVSRLPVGDQDRLWQSVKSYRAKAVRGA